MGGDPLAAYQRLRAAGVRTIVGPVTSEAASALMAPATADGVLLISPSSTAPSLARAVRFLASTFVTPLEAGTPGEVDAALAAPAALAERARTRLGHAPNSYVNTAYDALWCLAQTREELGGLGDPARVKSALYARSQTFKGTAGPMALNPQGDRMVGTYGFFGLDADAWKLEALYGNTTYQRLN